MKPPNFEWRQGRFGPEFGYDGGDGEILPPRDVVNGNQGSWIRLGRVLQDGEYGFCYEAIGCSPNPNGGYRRVRTEAQAKALVVRYVTRWVKTLIAAWEQLQEHG